MGLGLNARDRELLAFAAGHRFVFAGQVARLLGIGEEAADGRLRALAQAGYVRHEQRLNDAPAAHRITRAGLRAVGSALPAPRPVDLSLHDHDAALGWLELAARRGRFGPVTAVVTERQMRSDDGRTDDPSRRHGVRVGGVGPGGRDRVHHPDLVVHTATGHRVAFELELTTKSPRRREQILSAYAADHRIDAVVYLVDRRAAGRAIERSAARLGISDLILVQAVSLIPPGRDGEAGAGRRRAHARATSSAGRGAAGAAER